MTPSELEARVLQIVAETMKVSPESLTAETTFVADLDADSVAMVDILMALEDAFGVALVDKYDRDIKTVGDVISFLIAQLPK